MEEERVRDLAVANGASIERVVTERANRELYDPQERMKDSDHDNEPEHAEERTMALEDKPCSNRPYDFADVKPRPVSYRIKGSDLEAIDEQLGTETEESEDIGETMEFENCLKPREIIGTGPEAVLEDCEPMEAESKAEDCCELERPKRVENGVEAEDPGNVSVVPVAFPPDESEGFEDPEPRDPDPGKFTKNMKTEKEDVLVEGGNDETIELLPELFGEMRRLEFEGGPADLEVDGLSRRGRVLEMWEMMEGGDVLVEREVSEAYGSPEDSTQEVEEMEQAKRDEEPVCYTANEEGDRDEAQEFSAEEPEEMRRVKPDEEPVCYAGCDVKDCDEAQELAAAEPEDMRSAEPEAAMDNYEYRVCRLRRERLLERLEDTERAVKEAVAVCVKGGRACYHDNADCEEVEDEDIDQLDMFWCPDREEGNYGPDLGDLAAMEVNQEDPQEEAIEFLVLEGGDVDDLLVDDVDDVHLDVVDPQEGGREFLALEEVDVDDLIVDNVDDLQVDDVDPQEGGREFLALEGGDVDDEQIDDVDDLQVEYVDPQEGGREFLAPEDGDVDDLIVDDLDNLQVDYLDDLEDDNVVFQEDAIEIVAPEQGEADDVGDVNLDGGDVIAVYDVQPMAGGAVVENDDDVEFRILHHIRLRRHRHPAPGHIGWSSQRSKIARGG
ncbi:uncharacterized protein LOC124172897 [Ischnura elegans]|uniref:uncharacterized protein LOC124172897 n=1 Tax=Ischnura elegans TaxID=197161 RepID=UPI001ED8AE45|nr:uncharacterized protein LOC124172897 [Ischnura elegans]